MSTEKIKKILLKEVFSDNSLITANIDEDEDDDDQSQLNRFF